MIVRQPVYPMFPASSWWPLRRQFRRKLPTLVDAGYLVTVLGIEEKTARNLVPTLRHFGLVDADGRPTERAHLWRVDSTYPEFCRMLREEIYPPELFATVPDPKAEPERAVDWFMRTSGVGEAAARRMARLYELLAEADPTREGDYAERRRSRSIALRRPALDEPRRPFPDETASAPDATAGHVELHFHFDGDLTAQQIEKIFQSMGQYLRK
jgi:hypothetical protein